MAARGYAHGCCSCCWPATSRTLGVSGTQDGHRLDARRAFDIRRPVGEGLQALGVGALGEDDRPILQQVEDVDVPVGVKVEALVVGGVTNLGQDDRPEL
jgi:hypothetical protein